MIITRDLSLPEGPIPLEEGAWLVTELDTTRGTVVRITREGIREPIAKTGRPNGLAMAADGTVWVAESLEPSIIHLDLNGEFTRDLYEVEGRPLLWPNDLCFGPDGALYITDSGLLVGDFLIDGKPVEGAENMKTEGLVFRYDPRTGDAAIIDEGLGFTNGIAFGPDGLLYANETMTGNIYRYDLKNGGTSGERELFGNVNDPEYSKPGLHGPDGMAFSSDGRLWVAVFGQGDITVLGTDGKVDHRIPVDGSSPTNVTFGPDEERRIYVVEDEFGSLSTIDVDVGGLPLHIA